MRIRDKTDYPEIFICYWGSFSCNDRTIDETIISNRNNFVRTNNITEGGIVKCKISKKIKERSGIKLEYLDNIRTFDHLEFYKNKDEWFIIFSPYDDQTELITKYNFVEIPKLYNNYSKTYLKKVALF